MINEMISSGDDKYLSRHKDEAYIEYKRKCNFREPNQPNDEDNLEEEEENDIISANQFELEQPRKEK